MLSQGTGISIVHEQHVSLEACGVQRLLAGGGSSVRSEWGAPAGDCGGVSSGEGWQPPVDAAGSGGGS